MCPSSGFADLTHNTCSSLNPCHVLQSNTKEISEYMKGVQKGWDVRMKKEVEQSASGAVLSDDDYDDYMWGHAVWDIQ